MPTLLPNARQQFVDLDGTPYAGGLVYFYVPGTTTPKDTYLDAAGKSLNTNPVILDSAGQATVYGTGSYRQVLKDALGNLVWDQVTADTSSAGSSWAGRAGGTVNAITLTAPNFSSQDGQQIGFIAAYTPTGPFSITVNGTAIPTKVDGANGPAAVGASSLVADNAYTLTYDATGGFLHLTPIADAGAISAAIAAGDAATLAAAEANTAAQANVTLQNAHTYADNTAVNQGNVALTAANSYTNGSVQNALGQAQQDAQTRANNAITVSEQYAAAQAASALNQSNTALSNAQNSNASTYSQGVRLSGTYNAAPAGRQAGSVCTAAGGSTSNYAYLQYNINGQWRTAADA